MSRNTKAILTTIVCGLFAIAAWVSMGALLWAASPTGSPVLYTAPDIATIPTTVTDLMNLRQRGSDPSNPASTTWNLYSKSGGLYYQNSAGSVSQIATVTGAQVIVSVRAVQSLAAGTTIVHGGFTDRIEYVQIQSTGGSLTSTANPRINTSSAVDGQLIVIMGQSATNTYTLGDGNGVKLAGGASITFDDRTNVIFRYDSSLSAWRMIGSVGGGGGGGTAASTSFSPTGGIAATNVQTALAEVDAEAEKIANKSTAATAVGNGYIGANASGRAAWNRIESYVVHTDLTVNSQIDASTQAVTTIGIQNSGAGNLLLNGTGNPRMTGCTSGNDSAVVTLVGLSTTKTVTIPTGNGIQLAGNIGSVIIGLPVGGTIGGGSATFKCRGSTTTWEQIDVPSAQQTFNANPTVSLAACGTATNPRWYNGAAPTDYTEFCAESGLVKQITYCLGVVCGSVTIGPLGATGAFEVQNSVAGTAFKVDGLDGKLHGSGVGVQTACTTLTAAVQGDDDIIFGSVARAITIKNVWCLYKGSAPTTSAQFTLKDGAANTMTHTVPVCQAASASGATISAAKQAVTGANAVLSAFEPFTYSVTNTPNPTGTQDYTVCVEYQTAD